MRNKNFIGIMKLDCHHTSKSGLRLRRARIPTFEFKYLYAVVDLKLRIGQLILLDDNLFQIISQSPLIGKSTSSFETSIQEWLLIRTHNNHNLY